MSLISDAVANLNAQTTASGLSYRISATFYVDTRGKAKFYATTADIPALASADHPGLCIKDLGQFGAFTAPPTQKQMKKIYRGWKGACVGSGVWKIDLILSM